MRALVIAGIVATTAPAAATPWADRCKIRLAAAAPKLASIGKATITLAPPPAPPKPGPYVLKDLDAIGGVKLEIVAGDHTYIAAIGSDHSNHRYRGHRGMEEKRYEEWHSPYVDSQNGDPPEAAVEPMLEEFHHHLTLGVVRAELRVEIEIPAAKRKPSSTSSDNQHVPSGLSRPPVYTGSLALFATTLRPVLEACWTDVLPDEDDVSLAWTTKCLAELSAAHAALVKLEPAFGNGKCTRETFGASCGNINGNEPKWNALTSLAGGGKPKLVWRDDGTNRKSYADGGALIWASDQLPATRFAALLAAFQTPLEHCSQLLRTNMYP